MVKIAISGKAKSGKNTLASFLIDELSKSEDLSMTSIQAFADPIKRIVIEMFPEADRNCLFGPSELRSNIIHCDYKDDLGNPLTYRQALLDIGARGRKYNPNCWIKRFDATMNEEAATNIIASDLRFINEYEYLKRNGFYTIRITRGIDSIIDDISETEQDTLLDNDFDLVIRNDMTIDDLRSHAKSLVNRLVC